MSQFLDPRNKYSTIDKNETSWKFAWDKIGDAEGWYSWRKQPGDVKFLCVGMIREEEAYNRIIANPFPLTIDDKIDLELWINAGGLDQYKPDPNREFEEEVSTGPLPEGWVPPVIEGA